MKAPLATVRERLLRAGVAPRHVRRFLREIADHRADLILEEMTAGRSQADAEAAAAVRLGDIDTLAQRMIEQPQLRGWPARAPWLVCGILPLVSLAAAWMAALLILWSGWNLFLPSTVTPLGAHPVFWYQNIYFQVGRSLYLGAPLALGWGIGWLALRHRLSLTWPLAGLALVALAGGAGQVRASETVTGVHQVGLDFSLMPSLHASPVGLWHALILLSTTMLPYLLARVWVEQRA